MENYNRVSPEFLDGNGLVFVLDEKSLKSQIYFHNWWVDLKPPQQLPVKIKKKTETVNSVFCRVGSTLFTGSFWICLV